MTCRSENSLLQATLREEKTDVMQGADSERGFHYNFCFRIVRSRWWPALSSSQKSVRFLLEASKFRQRTLVLFSFTKLTSSQSFFPASTSSNTSKPSDLCKSPRYHQAETPLWSMISRTCTMLPFFRHTPAKTPVAHKFIMNIQSHKYLKEAYPAFPIPSIPTKL